MACGFLLMFLSRAIDQVKGIYTCTRIKWLLQTGFREKKTQKINGGESWRMKCD